MSQPQPVAVTSITAPWGPVHIAATAVGVVAVELMTTREAFIDGLVARLDRPVAWVPSGEPVPGPLGTAAATIAAAIGGEAGAQAALDGLPIDLGGRPAWDRAVLDAVRAIPRGETRSYGDIARAIGRPGAARAVGGAVGRNPIGLVIPCHRVIAGDGTLGGYGGGWWGERDRLLDLKAELLAREGVQLRRSRSGT